MDIEQLRSDYEQAEAELARLGNEYDENKRQIRERYEPQLAEASTKAAAAQKALMDAEAAREIQSREDWTDERKANLARELGLTLPSG
jgi:hypothetical protein